MTSAALIACLAAGRAPSSMCTRALKRWRRSSTSDGEITTGEGRLDRLFGHSDGAPALFPPPSAAPPAGALAAAPPPPSEPFALAADALSALVRLAYERSR